MCSVSCHMNCMQNWDKFQDEPEKRENWAVSCFCQFYLIPELRVHWPWLKNNTRPSLARLTCPLPECLRPLNTSVCLPLTLSSPLSTQDPDTEQSCLQGINCPGQWLNIGLVIRFGKLENLSDNNKWDCWANRTLKSLKIQRCHCIGDYLAEGLSVLIEIKCV